MLQLVIELCGARKSSPLTFSVYTDLSNHPRDYRDTSVPSIGAQVPSSIERF